MKAIWLSALFCLLSLSTIAQTISIQGVLRDPNGKAVEDGAYSVTFKIYDVPSGGTAVWTEQHPSLSVKHGVFNAPLGSIQAFNGVAFDDSTYVGVTVDGFAEMSPRIQLSTFPSAMSVNGTQNIFPSDGNVQIREDHLVLGQGSIKLNNGEIIFPDSTRLNSAEAGSANTVTSRVHARIIADDDTTTSGEIQFIIADTQYGVIDQQGDLGIGIDAPTHKLHVVSNQAAIASFESTHADQASLSIRNATQSTQWDLVNDGGKFHLRNGSVQALTINTNNKVGIGNNNPQQAFNVGNGVGIDPASGNDAGFIRFGNGTGQSLAFTTLGGTPLMDLQDNGDLSLSGDLSVSQGLTVADSASFADDLSVAQDLTIGDKIQFGGMYAEASSGGISGSFFNHDISFTNHLDFRNSSNDQLALSITDNDALVFRGFSLSSTISSPNAGYLSFGDGTGWKFHFYSPAQDRFLMTVTDQGRVGIGTPNPLAALHVRTTVNGDAFTSHDMDRYTWNHVNAINNQTYRASVYVEGYVMSNNGFIAANSPNFSDIRFKNILQRSDINQDLATIKQIEITDYRYIDASVSQKDHKKVIAQQVAKIYPQAIGYIPKAIPNVYERTTDLAFRDGQLTIRTQKAHAFGEDDKIDFYTATESFNQVDILEIIDENTFVVKMESKPEAVFVYGKWVDDFHTVDYDALSMLNISATQAIIKQVESLQTENAELKARLARLEALESKVDQLLNQNTRASLDR
ncbi:MAG: tail fiber domain-containing protein [Bacteroidia bacterium]